VTPAPLLVDLRAVGVRAGDTPILRKLDLTLAPGDVVGVVGDNGSGKTTLLRVCATLLRPSEGDGEVLGVPLDSVAREQVRPRIGLVGHAPALYPRLTLEENTAFAAEVTGTDPERAREALDTVGLGGVRHRRADHCSFGMQRRAEFARLLMLDPELLLLDEAHAGLDRHAAELVDYLVTGARSRGGGAIVVSHDAHRVAGLVDRTYVMEDGRLDPAPNEGDGP
jgi:ABC-type multidrug transport system ATPase subunit